MPKNNQEYHRQYYLTHREKFRVYGRKSYQKHRAAVLERQANRNFAEYGLTPTKYQEILAAQDGVCAICKEPPIGQRLAVDHNHQTSKVRGLLCRTCNRVLIGGFRNRPDLFERAATYLRGDDKQ